MDDTNQLICELMSVIAKVSLITTLVLLQASLQPLHTPGIQAFLHLLPTVCGLWMIVEVGPLTKETALGVAPTAGLGALKVIVSLIKLYNATFVDLTCQELSSMCT